MTTMTAQPNATTLTIDVGDLYAVQNVRREIAGRPACKAYKLTAGERERCHWVAGTSFSKVVDFATGKIVTTREWKHKWSKYWLPRIKGDQVSWIPWIAHIGGGRHCDYIRARAHRVEGDLWRVAFGIRQVGHSPYLANELFFNAGSAEELATMVTPLIIKLGEYCEEAYGPFAGGDSNIVFRNHARAARARFIKY